jgi:hypothetical protein
MARVTRVQLIDDLDDTPIDDGAGRTLTFAVDGTAYEIDLHHENVEKFHGAVAPFLALRICA